MYFRAVQLVACGLHAANDELLSSPSLGFHPVTALLIASVAVALMDSGSFSILCLPFTAHALDVGTGQGGTACGGG